MKAADTSQRIEEQKLELVKALAGIVAPMDAILADYQERQEREKELTEKVERMTFYLLVMLAVVLGVSVAVVLFLVSAFVF